MRKFHLISALLLATPLMACGESAESPTEAEGEAPAADYERGPHNGRFLRDKNFAIEVTVFEDGVPPEYRLYAYRDDKPVAPEEVQARVTIKRLDGEVTTFSFEPQDDWVAHVVASVTRAPAHNDSGFSLNFTRANPRMTACLDVEPVLANGRRPDYRLRFTVAAAQGGRRSIFRDVVQSGSQAGLVMDAKFRTRWKPGELSSMLTLLVDIKKYDQDGDKVFILQPAKAAIEGLTRSLARELGRENIRVNAIIPGNVQTPRQMKWYTPEGEAEIVAAQCLDGRIQPADIAAMAMFLVSDDARFCTSHNYWVDAGWR